MEGGLQDDGDDNGNGEDHGTSDDQGDPVQVGSTGRAAPSGRENAIPGWKELPIAHPLGKDESTAKLLSEDPINTPSFLTCI